MFARPWPFGRPPYLGGTLMKYAIHRLESSPDNVGHWQRSVALEVPLGRVSARLRKEPTNTFGKIATTFPLISEPPGSREPGIWEWPGRPQALHPCRWSSVFIPDSRANQVPRDVQGSSSPLLGIKQESESKRKRLSASKGTREARLSRIVATLGRSSDRLKHLPMRQPSGGAPVVVRGRESRPHGEGVQDGS
jgi:hypothetical protein